jgi:hypothetical protein
MLIDQDHRHDDRRQQQNRQCAGEAGARGLQAVGRERAQRRRQQRGQHAGLLAPAEY